MEFIVFIPAPRMAEAIVSWIKWGVSPGDNLEVICRETESDNTTTDAVRAALSEFKDVTFEISSTWSDRPVHEVLERCKAKKADRLITGPFDLGFDGRPQTSFELVRSAPCATFAPLYGHTTPKELSKILVFVTGGSHDAFVVRLADTIRKERGVKVTIATVEPESSEKAERAGVRAIRAMLHEAAIDEEGFEIKAVANRQLYRGMASCHDDHELIMIGSDGANDLASLHRVTKGAMAIAVKRNPPLQLRNMPDWLPRINPKDHADLLQDLRQGSRWGPDFIVMLTLASAIATLGLKQNSPAVVIGSMLLAPLMTPMIGTGLALAQANLQLARFCGKSIFYGFLLTLGVSFSLSILLAIIAGQRATLSPEVLSRGGPNILDLMIALSAAVAATFAMARPNIAGAVAGVAIATALVPPVCAVGVSLAAGNEENAFGAFVLFATNLIAIIVASSLTFTVLGVRTTRSLAIQRQVTQYVLFGLGAMLSVLAIPLALMLEAQFQEGRPTTAVYSVTRALSAKLHDKVDEEPGVDITFMGRPSAMRGVVIHLSATRPLPESFADELRTIVQDEMRDPELEVWVVCVDGQWISNQDIPAEVDPSDENEAERDSND